MPDSVLDQLYADRYLWLAQPFLYGAIWWLWRRMRETG